ncbi:MAG: hypothetical protein HOV87_20970 [Catenulispora sp.]|nr:hypothetical protein [Catenulispora sp.]
MRIRTMAVTAAFAVMAALGSAALAAPANAAGDTYCNKDDGSLCLYYLGSQSGAHVGVIGDVYNYDQDPNSCWSQGCNPYTFISGGSGSGQNIRNNAESYVNESSGTFCVYYSPGMGNPYSVYDVIPSRYVASTYYGNLNHTYNNNASQRRC